MKSRGLAPLAVLAAVILALTAGIVAVKTLKKTQRASSATEVLSKAKEIETLYGACRAWLSLADSEKAPLEEFMTLKIADKMKSFENLGCCWQRIKENQRKIEKCIESGGKAEECFDITSIKNSCRNACTNIVSAWERCKEYGRRANNCLVNILTAYTLMKGNKNSLCSSPEFLSAKFKDEDYRNAALGFPCTIASSGKIVPPFSCTDQEIVLGGNIYQFRAFCGGFTRNNKLSTLFIWNKELEPAIRKEIAESVGAEKSSDGTDAYDPDKCEDIFVSGGCTSLCSCAGQLITKDNTLEVWDGTTFLPGEYLEGYGCCGDDPEEQALEYFRIAGEEGTINVDREDYGCCPVKLIPQNGGGSGGGGSGGGSGGGFRQCDPRSGICIRGASDEINTAGASTRGSTPQEYRIGHYCVYSYQCYEPESTLEINGKLYRCNSRGVWIPDLGPSYFIVKFPVDNGNGGYYENENDEAYCAPRESSCVYNGRCYPVGSEIAMNFAADDQQLGDSGVVYGSVFLCMADGEKEQGVWVYAGKWVPLGKYTLDEVINEQVNEEHRLWPVASISLLGVPPGVDETSIHLSGGINLIVSEHIECDISEGEQAALCRNNFLKGSEKLFFINIPPGESVSSAEINPEEVELRDIFHKDCSSLPGGSKCRRDPNNMEKLCDCGIYGRGAVWTENIDDPQNIGTVVSVELVPSKSSNPKGPAIGFLLSKGFETINLQHGNPNGVDLTFHAILLNYTVPSGSWRANCFNAVAGAVIDGRFYNYHYYPLNKLTVVGPSRSTLFTNPGAVTPLVSDYCTLEVNGVKSTRVLFSKYIQTPQLYRVRFLSEFDPVNGKECAFIAGINFVDTDAMLYPTTNYYPTEQPQEGEILHPYFCSSDGIFNPLSAVIIPMSDGIYAAVAGVLCKTDNSGGTPKKIMDVEIRFYRFDQNVNYNGETAVSNILVKAEMKKLPAIYSERGPALCFAPGGSVEIPVLISVLGEPSNVLVDCNRDGTFEKTAEKKDNGIWYATCTVGGCPEGAKDVVITSKVNIRAVWQDASGNEIWEETTPVTITYRCSESCME